MKIFAFLGVFHFQNTHLVIYFVHFNLHPAASSYWSIGICCQCCANYFSSSATLPTLIFLLVFLGLQSFKNAWCLWNPLMNDLIFKVVVQILFTICKFISKSHPCCFEYQIVLTMIHCCHIEIFRFWSDIGRCICLIEWWSLYPTSFRHTTQTEISNVVSFQLLLVRCRLGTHLMPIHAESRKVHRVWFTCHQLLFLHLTSL